MSDINLFKVLRRRASALIETGSSSLVTEHCADSPLPASSLTRGAFNILLIICTVNTYIGGLTGPDHVQ